ncbi:MAG: AIR synthase family protein [Candidatus Helarchaeota archaeon]
MLPIGKISNELLKKIVFKYLGIDNKDIIEGAHVAGDSAIVKFSKNKKYIALKSDPITGAIKNIGRHSIIININDIATRGARPKFFMTTILLPPNSTEEDLENICKDIHEAALEFKISIIGGHSEVTPVVKKPVIVGFMVGEINNNRLLMANKIEVDDQIILTKSVGIEGCSIIAHDHYDLIKDIIDPEIINEAKELINQICILKEAMAVCEYKGVKFMHDPTEGGLLGGLIEICGLINKGFILYENEIPIYNCINEICLKLEINSLRLLSSGALIIICNKEYSDKIIKVLTESGIPSKIIGEITDSGYKLLLKNGNCKEVSPEIYEELWKLES